MRDGKKRGSMVGGGRLNVWKTEVKEKKGCES